MVASASQATEGSTEPVEVDMSEIYLQVAGSEKKRRVYGLGSLASTFYPENFSSSSTTSRYDFTSDERFKQHMDEVVEQKVEVRVQELQQKMNEDMRIYKEQVQRDQQKMSEDMRKYKEQVERDQREMQQHMEKFMSMFSQSQPNTQFSPFSQAGHDATGP